MLSIVMLSADILNVAMPSVVMLSSMCCVWLC
jgi:hypothetical protein